MDGNTVSDPKVIKEQLQRILSSSEFKASPRQKKFLRFVVEMFLEGRKDEIKGYTVATEVFGRKANFDSISPVWLSSFPENLMNSPSRYFETTAFLIHLTCLKQFVIFKCE